MPVGVAHTGHIWVVVWRARLTWRAWLEGGRGWRVGVAVWAWLVECGSVVGVARVGCVVLCSE